jgi:hypothetical protein
MELSEYSMRNAYFHKLGASGLSVMASPTSAHRGQHLPVTHNAIGLRKEEDQNNLFNTMKRNSLPPAIG